MRVPRNNRQVHILTFCRAAISKFVIPLFPFSFPPKIINGMHETRKIIIGFVRLVLGTFTIEDILWREGQYQLSIINVCLPRKRFHVKVNFENAVTWLVVVPSLFVLCILRTSCFYLYSNIIRTLIYVWFIVSIYIHISHLLNIKILYI